MAPLAQLVEAVVAPLAQLLAQAPTLEPLVFLGGGFARLDRGLPARDLVDQCARYLCSYASR